MVIVAEYSGLHPPMLHDIRSCHVTFELVGGYTSKYCYCILGNFMIIAPAASYLNYSMMAEKVCAEYIQNVLIIKLSLQLI